MLNPLCFFPHQTAADYNFPSVMTAPERIAEKNKIVKEEAAPRFEILIGRDWRPWWGCIALETLRLGGQFSGCAFDSGFKANLSLSPQNNGHSEVG